MSSNSNIIWVLGVIITIFIIWIYYNHNLTKTENEIETFLTKISSLNNNKYDVQDYPNNDNAANMLAQINTNIQNIIECMNRKYPHDTRVKRLKERTKLLKIEEPPQEDGTSSYTINKGELMAICLRKKDAAKAFHSLDTLTFVIIHELAHIMTVSEGHTSEFMVNFKFILKEANSCGLYSPQDYARKPIVYCGVPVSHNPFYED